MASHYKLENGQGIAVEVKIDGGILTYLMLGRKVGELPLMTATEIEQTSAWMGGGDTFSLKFTYMHEGKAKKFPTLGSIEGKIADPEFVRLIEDLKAGYKNIRWTDRAGLPEQVAGGASRLPLQFTGWGFGYLPATLGPKLFFGLVGVLLSPLVLPAVVFGYALFAGFRADFDEQGIRIAKFFKRSFAWSDLQKVEYTQVNFTFNNKGSQALTHLARFKLIPTRGSPCEFVMQVRHSRHLSQLFIKRGLLAQEHVGKLAA